MVLCHPGRGFLARVLTQLTLHSHRPGSSQTKGQAFLFGWILLVILSFAWTGLIMGFISLRDVQDLVSSRWNKLWGWFFTMSVIGVSSFGIYLGRELRWNSWDILTNPNALLQDISSLILNPTDNLTMVAMTGAFSAFLIVSYLTIGNFREASSDLS